MASIDERTFPARLAALPETAIFARSPADDVAARLRADAIEA